MRASATNMPTHHANAAMASDAYRAGASATARTVSAAIVLDDPLTEDVFRQMDRHIDKWAERLASD